MTNSQSSSQQSPGFPAAVIRLIRWLADWRRRRRDEAELARLAQVGDYLLRDVGLDPDLVRRDPSTTTKKLTRRP